MAPTARAVEHDDAPKEDHYVVLHDVTWADYERLLEVRGERAVPRITYLRGLVELMSPSHDHENIKSVIGCLVETWCLENGVEFSTVGNWTIKDKKKKRGAEPDECWVFGPLKGSTRPDLAIEVVWTSGGIDKLEVWRKLGVREIWYWRRGKLTPYVLREEQYEEVAKSEALPGIDLDLLVTFLDRPSTSASILAYRDALRGKQKR